MKPVGNYKRRPFRNEDKHFINRNIRAKEVRCIDPDGNHTIMRIGDALALAESLDLDLVQISKVQEDIPTCKIVDYSKMKYELSKKDKAAKKKQRETAIKIKEIKFRPSTDDNDLKTKAKQAQEFLDDGHKIKLTMIFKGRELAYKDVALKTLDTFIGYLSSAAYESQPSMSGRFLSAIICRSNNT